MFSGKGNWRSFRDGVLMYRLYCRGNGCMVLKTEAVEMPYVRVPDFLVL